MRTESSVGAVVGTRDAADRLVALGLYVGVVVAWGVTYVVVRVVVRDFQRGW